MPLNLYLRPDTLQTHMGTSASASVTDAQLAVLIEMVCRHLDRLLDTRFYSETATVEFDGNGGTALRLGLYAAESHRRNLISITTLKVDTTGDGTFDKTLSEGTDYWRDPDNPSTTNEPVRKLLIPSGRSTSPQIGVWPSEKRRIQIVGKWGWSEETAAGGTLGAAVANGTATAITITIGDDIVTGDTILIETEQLYCSLVSGTAATVVRGVNGTTAAAHDNGKTITRRVYPADIEQAVMLESARGYRQIFTGQGGLVTDVSSSGQVNYSPVFAQISELRDLYRALVFA